MTVSLQERWNEMKRRVAEDQRNATERAIEQAEQQLPDADLGDSAYDIDPLKLAREMKKRSAAGYPIGSNWTQS